MAITLNATAVTVPNGQEWLESYLDFATVQLALALDHVGREAVVVVKVATDAVDVERRGGHPLDPDVAVVVHSQLDSLQRAT